jgi:hypothetical protein
MTDTIEQRLRDNHIRYAAESEDQASARRIADCREAAAEIESLKNKLATAGIVKAYWKEQAETAWERAINIAETLKIKSSGHPQIDAPTPGDMQKQIVEALKGAAIRSSAPGGDHGR